MSIDPRDLKLTDDPVQQNEVFLAAFNTGDGAVFDSLYRDDAISNLSGSPLTGAERTRVITEFLAQKPRLDAKFLNAYVAGDALLIFVEYDMEVPQPDGDPVHMRGTCTDVLRRDEDGNWRMVIDRPVAEEEYA
ncbi:nuclear transport factor 2 family protein [Streptomyces nogalater]|uniref:Nuclear transport factor 2 family protein n=1 Tax=Streptomyces nogalater TaxID=38314 RepID=A0ABW0WM98_STRNO